jgi:HAD superfamily hydrolase (TIGR01484 family)
MGRISLVALDLDGTILSNGVISLDVKRYLGLLDERGVKVSIVTGRDLPDIEGILERNRFSKRYPHSIIAEGAFVYYLSDGRYLPDEEWNLERRRDLERLRRSIGPLSHKFAMDVRRVVRPVDELVEDGVIYFAFSTNEEAEKARVLLDELLAPFPLAKIIRNKRFIALTSRTGLKGSSLKRVIAHYGIPSGEVLAIGDSHNDEDMLNDDKGFRVATTSNADDVIKELVLRRGGYVASKAIGEGVLEIFDRFFSGEGLTFHQD